MANGQEDAATLALERGGSEVAGHKSPEQLKGYLEHPDPNKSLLDRALLERPAQQILAAVSPVVEGPIEEATLEQGTPESFSSFMKALSGEPKPWTELPREKHRLMKAYVQSLKRSGEYDEANKAQALVRARSNPPTGDVRVPTLKPLGLIGKNEAHFDFALDIRKAGFFDAAMNRLDAPPAEDIRQAGFFDATMKRLDAPPAEDMRKAGFFDATMKRLDAPPRETIWENGKLVGKLVKNILYQDGKKFSGVAPRNTDGGLCAYLDGVECRIVPDNGQALYLKQGAMGNCYSLASLYGHMQSGRANEHIEKIMELKPDGSVTLSFSPSSAVHLKSMQDPEIVKYMGEQGYQVEVDGNNLKIDISREKLGKILSEPGTSTNSLFVRVMDRLVGNMAKTPGDARNAALSSTIAHEDRTVENLEDVVAGLLGKRSHPLFSYKEKNSSMPHLFGALQVNTKLSKALKICGIDLINKDNSAYLSMKYKIGRHAFAVIGVNLDDKNNVKSVILSNPHDATLLETHDFVDLQDVKLKVFKPC
ncbi:hypothetical protein [Variovorax saccharolyticus]|uniref:hypothetical protein n=1 Tax=Variovorax saccharolyticus TaxID=3053516 RepID=UPI002577CD40|nr:hypothetical protein [Variovorax sp. J31P216]MDM0030087.1 hypothetical protein [Variovorax sp. J31P216]